MNQLQPVECGLSHPFHFIPFQVLNDTIVYNITLFHQQQFCGNKNNEWSFDTKLMKPALMSSLVV